MDADPLPGWSSARRAVSTPPPPLFGSSGGFNRSLSFYSSIMLPSSVNSSSSSGPLRSTSSSGPLAGASPPALSFPTLSSEDPADLENMLLWTLHEPGTIALTVMYCLSFILGFSGNLMSLRVLTTRRGRRLAGVSATHSLLVNLAVCDLAVVCVCMPITLGSQIYTAWVYGDPLCRAVPFTQAVSVSASVLTLTVISVNRYYSVRSPLRARAMFTRRRILAAVAVVWAASSLMCAPIAVVNRRREISFGTFTILVCQEEWPRPRLKQGYNVLLFVVLYCLPVTFNLTIGFLTGRRLWGGKKSTFSDLDPRSQALHASRLKTRQKIAKMVVCLVLLFAASWLPLYLVDLWIDREERPPSWLLQTRPFAQWLGLTNSSLNPICYCFIGDLYRSAKVIRTRYHQKVASLFSTTSFSGSVAAAASAAVVADASLCAADHDHVTGAAAVSTPVMTIPRLLSSTGVAGSGRGEAGSDRSTRDRCRSDPAPPPRPPPARRHSLTENFGSSPLKMERTDTDVPPARRHSGDRMFGLSDDTTDGGSSGKERLCYSGRRRTPQSYAVVEEREEREQRSAEVNGL